MAKTDYIPAKDTDAAAWFTNFAIVLAANLALYGVAAPVSAEITTKAAAYAAALNVATTPETRTSATIAAKDAARAAVTFLVRPVAVTISVSAGIPNEDKVTIGVTTRSGGRTPITAPASAPGLVHVSSSPGVTSIAYRDAAPGTSRPKPPGAQGVQLFTAFGTVPAAGPEACQYNKAVTKTPATIDTPAGMAGRQLTVYARYVTGSGSSGEQLYGPWSAPFVVVAM